MPEAWDYQPTCDCPECQRISRRMVAGDAVTKAESLLRGYLTPEQLEDWAKTGGFNVRGSDGLLYRINGGYDHRALVREDGYGTAVWVQEVTNIPADNALGLMFYLANRAQGVVASGCHSYSPFPKSQCPTDYKGTI